MVEGVEDMGEGKELVIERGRYRRVFGLGIGGKAQGCFGGGSLHNHVICSCHLSQIYVSSLFALMLLPTNLYSVIVMTFYYQLSPCHGV